MSNDVKPIPSVAVHDLLKPLVGNLVAVPCSAFYTPEEIAELDKMLAQRIKGKVEKARRQVWTDEDLHAPEGEGAPLESRKPVVVTIVQRWLVAGDRLAILATANQDVICLLLDLHENRVAKLEVHADYGLEELVHLEEGVGDPPLGEMVREAAARGAFDMPVLQPVPADAGTWEDATFGPEGKRSEDFETGWTPKSEARNTVCSEPAARYCPGCRWYMNCEVQLAALRRIATGPGAMKPWNPK